MQKGKEQREHTGNHQSHKDNLRHLPRLPGFFVTFRILSTYQGQSSPGDTLGISCKEE